MNEQVSFLRHSAWISPEDYSDPIVVIGCGAVGSNLALNLAKLGAQEFVLWDADIVEAHNLPNQAYMPKHIGMPKVEALASTLQEFNPDIKITTHKDFFTEEDISTLKGYLILATDNMQSRKMIGELVEPSVLKVFEVRLGFDYGELNIFDPVEKEQRENWLSGLQDDSEVPEGPCNQRICTTLVNLICAHAAHMVASTVRADYKNLNFNPKSKSMFVLNDKFEYYEL